MLAYYHYSPLLKAVQLQVYHRLLSLSSLPQRKQKQQEGEEEKFFFYFEGMITTLKDLPWEEWSQFFYVLVPEETKYWKR